MRLPKRIEIVQDVKNYQHSILLDLLWSDPTLKEDNSIKVVHERRDKK